MRTNAFREEAVADHEVEEYENALQDYWRSSKPNLTICRNKNHDYVYCKSIQRLCSR